MNTRKLVVFGGFGSFLTLFALILGSCSTNTGPVEGISETRGTANIIGVVVGESGLVVPGTVLNFGPNAVTSQPSGMISASVSTLNNTITATTTTPRGVPVVFTAGFTRNAKTVQFNPRLPDVFELQSPLTDGLNIVGEKFRVGIPAKSVLGAAGSELQTVNMSVGVSASGKGLASSFINGTLWTKKNGNLQTISGATYIVLAATDVALVPAQMAPNKSIQLTVPKSAVNTTEFADTIQVWQFDVAQYSWVPVATAALTNDAFTVALPQFGLYVFGTALPPASISGRLIGSNSVPLPFVELLVADATVTTDSLGEFFAYVPSGKPLTIQGAPQSATNHESQIDVSQNVNALGAAENRQVNVTATSATAVYGFTAVTDAGIQTPSVARIQHGNSVLYRACPAGSAQLTIPANQAYTFTATNASANINVSSANPPATPGAIIDGGVIAFTQQKMGDYLPAQLLSVRGLSFSPDGQYLAVIGQASALETKGFVYNVSTLQLVVEVAFASTADGGTATHNGQFPQWSTDSRKVFFRNAGNAATGGYVVDIVTKKKYGHAGTLNAWLTPDGQQLIMKKPNSADTLVFVHALSGTENSRQFAGDSAEISAIISQPIASVVVGGIGTDRSQTRVYNIGSTTPRVEYSTPEFGLAPFTNSGSGDFQIFGATAKSLAATNTGNVTPLTSARYRFPIAPLAISNAGEHAITQRGEGQTTNVAALRTLPSGNVLRLLIGNDPLEKIQSAAFSPDGTTYVLGVVNTQGTARVVIVR
ncbi:MAG: hypothetical protein HQ472_01015 [Ignavibacteria bacterium]|nr:hypothetical protein [Ignavibacteria bacterium]